MRNPTRGIAVLLILAMSFAGCISSTAIKPTELPKLNLAQPGAPGSNGGPGQPTSVIHLETPDGRLTEVKGEPDVHLQLKNNTEMLFQHPIQSSVDGQALTIMSGSLPKTTIPLGNIEKLELRHDYTASGIGLVVGLVVTAVLPILIVRAAR